MIPSPIAAPKPRSMAAPAPIRSSCRLRRRSISAMPTKPTAILLPSPTSRTSMHPRCPRPFRSPAPLVPTSSPVAAARDTIDGGGGADTVSGGGGDDIVAYNASETAIDGGTGTNTLQLPRGGHGEPSATPIRPRAIRSTSPISSTWMRRCWEQASPSRGLRLRIRSRAARATTPSTAQAGRMSSTPAAANDTITYRGTEVSIDGGAGTDMLVLAATGGITSINLGVAAGADQTTGDTVNVTNVESVNAGIFTTALTVTGSSGANTITTGSGNDTIGRRGRCGQHQRRRRQRHRLLLRDGDARRWRHRDQQPDPQYVGRSQSRQHQSAVVWRRVRSAISRMSMRRLSHPPYPSLARRARTSSPAVRATTPSMARAASTFCRPVPATIRCPTMAPKPRSTVGPEPTR